MLEIFIVMETCIFFILGTISISLFVVLVIHPVIKKLPESNAFKSFWNKNILPD